MGSKLDKIQKLREKKKVEKLVKLTSSREESEVRAAAFEALGDIDCQLSGETLQNAIRDEDPAVRMAIAKAFQKIGSDHVEELLHHQMLKETDEALKQEFEKAMEFSRKRRYGG